MSTSIKQKHIPNLTPIRFFLALLVVIYHIPQFSNNRGFPFFNDLAIFHKGREAVYMFFALSGFLIIKQLFIEKKKTGTVNLKGFYIRRILRIFPLYYLILIIGFLYYQLILPHLGFDFENNYDLITGIFLSVCFLPNVFATFSPGGILEILWSIGIEEQFYLLIAPLFLLLPVKRVVFFLGVFTTFYFLVFFSEQFIFFRKYDMLYYYFSFSGICAILWNKKHIQRTITIMRLPILVLFILYFVSDIFSKNLNDIIYHAFSVLLFGFTIAVLAVKPIRFLENKVMNYLGKISYGIYMYHAIAMQSVGFLFLKLLPKFKINNALTIITINVLVIGITITVSHFSYQYFEKYFLKMKRKTRNN
ncbi:acyltransferase [Patiriisocius marinistellae]|uniref:Acyltransferase n=1 Tax=Patiriisocius marinistellae TaxID=2494560 RepID=A0A5J4G1W5_9FLAO|nr:acyltransferase [Patiriisocius marinistellae]GEQ86606.1 acyltransferase [Patiriisocius marinistellae]